MLTIYGNVEVEGSYLNTEGTAKESNLALATARVGLQLDIAENIGGRIIFLHEEGEDETVKIDEANIVISWPQIGGGVLQAIGGRIYLPFGNYSSNFISDPLTLELGESDKTAVLIGWRNNLVDFNCAIFNGDRPVDDNIEEFVASLTA